MSKDKQKISKFFFYLIVACYMMEGIVDVIVGSSWPVIARTIRVDISLIGMLNMVYYMGSIITSSRTYKIRQKLGTNYTMVLSHICFGFALILYIIATNIYILFIGMFINGVGCGLMEVNANSYVLKAYDVKGESILSSFWGLGSVLGSTIMATAVRYFPPYQKGFAILVGILVINIILLLIAKKHWVKKRKTMSKEIVDLHSVTDEEKNVNIKIISLIKNRKIILILISFFFAEGVIITLNSLVSTILVSQGNISESSALGITILFFVAIFLGRMIFGNTTKKGKIISILKINSFIVSILLLLLFMCPAKSAIISVLTITIGFISAPIIPFLYAYLKETFDVTLLSALLGYGDVCGVIGIISMSGLTTFILGKASVKGVEIFFAISLLILFLIFIKAEKLNNESL